MMDIKIREITIFEQKQFNRVNELLTNLTDKPIILTAKQYQEQVINDNNHLFFAYHNNYIVGMLSVIIYISPTGKKAMIEDVVVDREYQSQGVGRQIVLEAINLCGESGVETIMLTSKPNRIEANKLYQSIGFEKKATNFYTLTI